MKKHKLIEIFGSDDEGRCGFTCSCGTVQRFSGAWTDSIEARKSAERAFNYHVVKATEA